MTPQDELEDLRARLNALDAEQADARDEAEAALKTAQASHDAVVGPLDEARDPLARRFHELAVEIAAAAEHRRRRTLTPWRMADCRSDYGSRYLAAQEAWYGNVAWLRLVTRDNRSPTMQWEAQIAGQGDVVYGPPTGEGRAVDFARHARDVDARLTALGYFINA